MEPIQGVVETGIYVDDLGRAEAFYHGLLGFPVIAREKGRHVFFQVGDRNVLLAFLPDATAKGDMLPGHGAKGPGHFAFGVSVGALDQWRRHLEQNGVAIEREMSWSGGARSIYFRDPAGNSVELVTPGLWGLPSGW